LPLNPRGRGALLQIAGLIDHQHRTRIAQALHHELPQVIADSIGVPARCGQQMLHAVGRHIPGILSDRPAILLRQARQQPQHKRPRVPPGLYPREPPSDPAHQLIEVRQPAPRVYAVASGHRKIITSRHKPG
jgi:hypothetical protein